MTIESLEIFELATLLRSGEISSVELCQHSLDRIQALENLNAFITIDASGALESARIADKRRSAGEDHLLLGIPIAHKDIFCTEGMRTTCGAKMLSNFIAPYDATVVADLKQAGAVMLGKTNMDEFAMGSSTEHSAYQPAKNPWNDSRVPGGSSGGSAISVAARMVCASTGTDTGGSIRQPAALCGITGVKPSYGRVSRFGMVAFASSLDQAGVFTRSVRDAAIMMDTIARFDPKDSTSIDTPSPNCFAKLESEFSNLKIGIPQQHFGYGLDSQVADAIHAALAQFESLGATLVDIDLPNSEAAIPCYYVIAPAEASSNLSRFDGVRYGYRAPDAENLEDLYKKSRTEGFGAEVKRRIMIGTYVLSHGYYDAYYLNAQRIRRLIASDYDRAFEQCDIIAGPTSPTTAFEIGAKTQDPVKMYLNDIYTAAVNLAGLPALSIPAGFDSEGLPVGLHMVGQYMGEADLLRAAHMFQRSTDHHLKIPKTVS